MGVCCWGGGGGAVWERKEGKWRREREEEEEGKGEGVGGIVHGESHNIGTFDMWGRVCIVHGE